MIINHAQIKVIREEDIEVNHDSEGKQHTNESIFEFIINRKANIVPASIKLSDKFATTSGFSQLPSGAYSPPVGNFNISRACVWITQNSYDKYIKDRCGQCAKNVRLALEAGGINTAGRPVSAYQYAGFLPKIGFKLITTLKTLDEQKNFTTYNAKPGDVAVMAHGQHGHICLYNGNQWVSDFKQNGMWVYGGNGTCQIFRYTKI